jgi:uncharacterized protein (TIGR02145 family)
VITSPVTELSWYYAIAGGEVLDDGGSPITSRGVCVTEKESDPPSLDSKFEVWSTTDSTGIGSFISTIPIHWHGVPSYTNTHYYRAYATNAKGTTYGELLSFYPKQLPPSSDAFEIESITVKATSAIVKYHTEEPSIFHVDERGLCYNTVPNPSYEGSHFIVDGGSLMSATISNLTPNTMYYVRGYLKNESAIAYSAERSFVTNEGEISDIDGNIYQIKTIGSQVWMIENLKVSKFNEGSNIPLVQENLEWNSTTTSAHCIYDNNKYGKLYNYYACVDNRALCPSGWHVPTDDEWKILEIQSGMSQSQADAVGLRGTNVGGELKQTGCSSEDWNCNNIGATNSTGFSALFGGLRYDNGIFYNNDESAYFWSSTEYDGTAWNRSLSKDNAQIGRLNVNKGFAFSVRCIKD